LVLYVVVFVSSGGWGFKDFKCVRLV